MRKFRFGKKKEDEQNCSIVPFTGLGLLENFGFSKLLDDFFTEPFGLVRGLKEPAVDIYEKENKVVVKAELPGMDKKDIRLKIDNNILTISGMRSAQREVKKENYYYLERSHGNIQRSVVLPEGAKQDNVKASYKDGILTVELGKDKIDEKGKQIEIE